MFKRAKSPLVRFAILPLMMGLTVGIPLVNLFHAHAQDAKTQTAQEQPDPNTVIGTINGRQITNRDLDFAIGDLSDQLSPVPGPQQRFAALMALIDIKLLAAQAEAEGIDQTEAFDQRLDFLRDRALHNIYFREHVSDPVTDADVRARYDAEIAATPPQNEVRARHILVQTKEEADAIIAELEAGADFEQLAQEHSTGPSGPNGGDLGYFTRGRMVPAFEEAAFALEPGQFTTEPVQSEFGWHVIKVEDRRPVQPPPFAQVADQIRSVILRERYFEELKKLREAASIDISDPQLKAAYDEAISAGVDSPDQQAQ